MKHLFLALFLFLFACYQVSDEPEATQQASDELSCSTNVGLGLYFMNGQWNPDMSPFSTVNSPLSVTKGYDRFVEEIYLASFLPTTEESGLSPVMTTGEFSGLDWSGLMEDSVDWRLESNGVTYQRQIFYRDANWMSNASNFTLVFRNANGSALKTTKVRAGKDNKWKDSDDFGERRFVARVISLGCPSVGDCTGGQHFAEALVQLRVALHTEDTFTIPDNTSNLDLVWSALPNYNWQTPVVINNQNPSVGYGLEIALEEMNPPSRGYYLPGEQVQIRTTFKDGNGNNLFAPGAMPSYAEATNRATSAKGIRYLTFNGLPMLYWAHKPLQSAMQTVFAGPVHKMTTVGTTPITPFSLFQSEIPAATRAVDGWYSSLQETPITPIMFSCLLGLNPAACDYPTSDVYVYTIPTDAESGTYVTGIKARREWEGEPAMTAASLRIQVGSLTPTQFPGFPVTGLSPCSDCHRGAMKLSNSGHGFPNLNRVGPECLGCHTDGYYFEPDAGILTRLNYLHDQSRRLSPP